MMGPNTRRGFLKTCAAAGTSAALLGAGNAGAAQNGKPNLIYIFTDQQSATMMSCTGNTWLKTPAMDYIAENGIRFEKAYTTNPVCVPARIGMMSGRFPGEFNTGRGQVRENDGGLRVPKVSQDVKETNIAAQLGKAGYQRAYGGKVHLPRPLHPQGLGFEVISKDQRGDLAQACANFIKRKHDKPYYLVASFINPHDICYMALRGLTVENQTYKRGQKLNSAERKLLEAMKRPDGVSKDEFFEKHCPPLPPNYEPQQDEPKAVEWLLNRRNFKMKARKNYTDLDWRLHRWAYCRLTEYVDRQIQVVLDALKESGQEKNTVVVLSSDHGDMDAAHRMEHKTALYEESARIPFVVMHKGTAPAGRVDKTHLVSNGLDLLPTFCDYAGLEARPAHPMGRSLKSLIEGKADVSWRKTLGVESEIGRMVVGENCKYVRYDRGEEQEQLLDLSKDPHETRHFTDEASHAEVLKDLRAEFKTWFPKVGA